MRRPTGTVQVVVVGDAFLDVDWTGRVDRVCPDAPAPVLDTDTELERPGGAGLAALYAAEAGADVTLVTALGDDPEGERVRAVLEATGVTLVDLGLEGPTPVKLRLRAGGQSLARVDRHCSPVAAIGNWTEAADAAVEAAGVVLVSDYGRGLTGLAAVAALFDRAAVVWDPHPRGATPPSGVVLLTPNLAEARDLAPGDRSSPGAAGLAEAVEVGEEVGRRFGSPVVVTVGGAGAVLVPGPGTDAVVVPAERVEGDVCGAGDRFAATVATELARGADHLEAVTAAVDAARRHVAGVLARHGSIAAGASPRPLPILAATSAPASSPPALRPRIHDADGVGTAQAVRAAGGTVVVTGGCFDVVHAGHVRLLAAARELGDCLVVCVNDDASVRRLKGDGRPVNGLEDRMAVLAGLSCVDAVVPFSDDTPCDLLERLRPHLFVKGADYAGAPLPERRALASWGGRVVLLPLLQGRSTTRILRTAVAAS